jgi:predicted nuclease of predicted toxin-antitoxin system
VNDVFVKLYLDEDVDVLVAKLIRSTDFQAVTTDEVGRKGSTDPQQLECAISRQSAIVTHNRLDFEELAQQYFAGGQTHYGVIVSVQRLPQEIAERLLSILNDFTADEMKNQIIYI